MQVYKLDSNSRVYIYPWENAFKLCDLGIKTLYKTTRTKRIALHYMRRDIAIRLTMRYYDIDIDINDIELITEN